MYIDIEPNDNLDEPVMATFATTDGGRPVSRLRLKLDGEWTWCAVTGWDAGPAPATLYRMEESGDGEALLVVGSAQGLRLQILDDAQAQQRNWDLDDDQQWSEGFLICRPDLVFS
ncbi:MAG: hypothetical protein ACOCXJ_09105 [Planctomycetota bacterium]